MKLDFNSKLPIYHQISEMIKEAILNADLSAGDPIPSVREMSVNYGINPQTILNATALLINENVIEKKRGVGMFVSDSAKQILIEEEMKTFKSRQIPFIINRGEILGFNRKEICELIRKTGKGKKHE